MMDQWAKGSDTLLNNLSLEEVMEQYQSGLLRYAARILNNEDAAQDVIQETFIRLHKNWKKVSARRVSIKGWLFRTAHNTAVDYIRKESRRQNLHQKQSNQNLSYSIDNDTQRDRDERHVLVLEHLHVLKPNERAVLVLRLQEEMSYREIAVVLKRSEGYVGTLIHAATKKLTQSLQLAGVLS